MKYDRGMNMFEFIDLTLSLGYRFPWRLCASPAFRERIFRQFEGDVPPQKIIDDCRKLGYDCYYIGEKDGKPPTKEECAQFKDRLYSVYNALVRGAGIATPSDDTTPPDAEK